MSSSRQANDWSIPGREERLCAGALRSPIATRMMSLCIDSGDPRRPAVVAACSTFHGRICASNSNEFELILLSQITVETCDRRDTPENMAHFAKVNSDPARWFPAGRAGLTGTIDNFFMFGVSNRSLRTASVQPTPARTWKSVLRRRCELTSRPRNVLRVAKASPLQVSLVSHGSRLLVFRWMPNREIGCKKLVRVHNSVALVTGY